MKRMVAGILVMLTLLGMTGCAPLLERTYVTAEPHSSKFWESEAASTLRAENYQDVVNDLMICCCSSASIRRPPRCACTISRTI